MCPYGLEIGISTSSFPHFWQGNSRKSQDLAWEACSVQEKRIKRQQTVSSAGCKVLAPSPGFLLASMPSYCRFRPIECSYLQSVSVSVHNDKIRGSAISFSSGRGVSVPWLVHRMLSVETKTTISSAGVPCDRDSCTFFCCVVPSFSLSANRPGVEPE